MPRLTIITTAPVWVTNRPGKTLGFKSDFFLIPGPPAPSETYTTEELTKMGMTGWYKLVTTRDVIDLDDAEALNDLAGADE
jgi:hypothetical protein